MQKNFMLVLLGVFGTAIVSGMGKDVYELLKSVQWKTAFLQVLDDPVLQTALLGISLTLSVVYIYFRRWRTNIENPSVSYMLLSGPIIISFAVPFGIALLTGNTERLFADFKDSPYKTAFWLFIIAIWVGMDVLRLIASGKTSERITTAPQRRFPKTDKAKT